jgi:hypothetical protein
LESQDRSWFNPKLSSLKAILEVQKVNYPFLPAPFPCTTRDVGVPDHEMLLGSRYAVVPEVVLSCKHEMKDEIAQPPVKKQKLGPQAPPVWVESLVSYPCTEGLELTDKRVVDLDTTSSFVFVNLQKSGAGKTEAVAAAACKRYIVPLDMTTDAESVCSGALLGLFSDIQMLSKNVKGEKLDRAADRFLWAFAGGALLLLAVFHDTHGGHFEERRYEAFYRLVQECPRLLDVSYELLKVYVTKDLRRSVGEQVANLQKVVEFVCLALAVVQPVLSFLLLSLQPAHITSYCCVSGGRLSHAGVG